MVAYTQTLMITGKEKKYVKNVIILKYVYVVRYLEQDVFYNMNQLEKFVVLVHVV